ncbi:MAG TPA: Type 1 glutamine amidotransferase-like domain-containing protein [Opitutaceae bacterium]|nr:Type 1 glutamine amidotransferase-like domain-containing protein [Opitutaceae bacterium]
MSLSRRFFLQTLAAAGALSCLPQLPAEDDHTGLFPAGPNFHTSSAASVMVSGGTIAPTGQLTPAVRAAHKKLYGQERHLLLVLHASLPADRDRVEKQLQRLLAPDGFTAESLHHYQGAAARRALENASALFFGGGETFLLLRTLIETRQLAVVRECVLRGTPYHGTSAGANVAGPNIGCTNDFPIVDVPTRNSLGIFPGIINPHHPPAGDRDHAGRANKVRGYLRANPAETVLGLGNGAIAWVHQRKVELVQGPAFLYRASGSQELTTGDIAPLTAMAV